MTYKQAVATALFHADMSAPAHPELVTRFDNNQAISAFNRLVAARLGQEDSNGSR